MPPKILLVTGGGRGIGAATVLAASKLGYAVAVNYRTNQSAAESIVSAVIAASGTAVAIQADVSVESEIVRLFAEVDARLGRLTALVNNAGIVDRQCRVEDVNAVRLTRMLTTNVVGPFLCAREAVKRMSTRYGGRAGRSSTSPRPHRGSGRPASTSTTRRPKGQSTPSPSAWRRKWRGRGFG
jgi:NAD(P)-dependent dehydrogenase (short-subunit alcohol dehydrogenase family)